MKCPKCQFENLDGMNFCGKCGEKLEKVCPKCNFSNPPEHEFCGKCGQKFGEDEQLAPIDQTKPQSYTPKHLADKILTTRSSLEGERKIVTVLFADVANYTSMSEKLDPEEVLQIMDGAFKIMMDETHKYEGTINQFTGDGIMAIFGAPVAHENHAQRACYTALSIQKTMDDYSSKIENEYGLEFKIRIGINTGSVIVTAIGDDTRMDYTAVGDTTNLAARMESNANPGSIFVSGSTYKITERYFDFSHIGKTDVKGKEEPQDIYELLKSSEVATRIDESVARGLTRFVGRKNSMSALLDAYDQAKSGQGQVMGIVGEAGVGKSRLILEMRNRLPENEFVYLEGQCLQYGGSILYKPILDILRTLFDIKDDDREFIIKKKITECVSTYKNLEHTIPSFQDLLSVKVEDDTFLKLEPKQKRERIFESIRDLLITVSHEKPTVMVVEDLHWIDETSQAFLDYLIEWIASVPIMLILLYRTEYRHKWSSRTYYHKVGLDHLRKDSSIELVKAMLEGGDVVPELRDLILERAAGNPLFMEEFTRTLIENGTIKKQDSQYVLSQRMSELHVPNTVQDIIAARMDRLEENLKRTMQVASVIGRDFAFKILQTITGMREELKSYLLNLQGLEFIYEKSLFPDLEYIFKHALTQEVAYNSLLLKRRKQIHENIGKAIEEIYAERIEEFYEMLAYHYSKSNHLEKAFEYLKLSGEKAWNNYSIEESYAFYRDAIIILNRLPDTDENKKTKVKVSLLIYPPMEMLGFPKDSIEILQNAEKLSTEIGDKKSLASFYSYLCVYYTFRGNSLEGIRYAEPRFYEARRYNEVELMARLSFGLCASYSASGDYVKITDVAPDVISLLEKSKKEPESFDLKLNIYSWLCSIYGSSLALIGNFEEGKYYLEKGLNYAFSLNSVMDMGIGEFHYGLYSISKGDAENAIGHWQNSIKYFEEVDFPFFIALNLAFSGYGYRLLGDLDIAQKQIETGLGIFRDNQFHILMSTYPLYLSHVHHDLGDFTKAQSCVEEALELAQKSHERYHEGFSMIWLGRILAKNNSSKNIEAEKNISQGIKILKELNANPTLIQGYFFLGELYANTGRKDEAFLNLNKALSMCHEMGIQYWPDKIQEVLDRL